MLEKDCSHELSDLCVTMGIQDSLDRGIHCTYFIMPSLRQLSTVGSLVALAAASPAQSTNHPVCIIGAGPSGLTVAHELEAKGVPVAVFDQQNTVGGKCQSFYDGPNQ